MRWSLSLRLVQGQQVLAQYGGFEDTEALLSVLAAVVNEIEIGKLAGSALIGNVGVPLCTGFLA